MYLLKKGIYLLICIFFCNCYFIQVIEANALENNLAELNFNRFLFVAKEIKSIYWNFHPLEINQNIAISPCKRFLVASFSYKDSMTIYFVDRTTGKVLDRLDKIKDKVTHLFFDEEDDNFFYFVLEKNESDPILCCYSIEDKAYQTVEYESCHQRRIIKQIFPKYLVEKKSIELSPGDFLECFVVSNNAYSITQDNKKPYLFWDMHGAQKNFSSSEELGGIRETGLWLEKVGGEVIVPCVRKNLGKINLSNYAEWSSQQEIFNKHSAICSGFDWSEYITPTANLVDESNLELHLLLQYISVIPRLNIFSQATLFKERVEYWNELLNLYGETLADEQPSFLSKVLAKVQRSQKLDLLRSKSKNLKNFLDKELFDVITEINRRLQQGEIFSSCLPSRHYNPIYFFRVTPDSRVSVIFRPLKKLEQSRRAIINGFLFSWAEKFSLEENIVPTVPSYMTGLENYGAKEGVYRSFVDAAKFNLSGLDTQQYWKSLATIFLFGIGDPDPRNYVFVKKRKKLTPVIFDFDVWAHWSHFQKNIRNHHMGVALFKVYPSRISKKDINELYSLSEQWNLQELKELSSQFYHIDFNSKTIGRLCCKQTFKKVKKIVYWLRTSLKQMKIKSKKRITPLEFLDDFILITPQYSKK